MKRSVPKELYWLILTVLLLAVSVFYIVKEPLHYGLDINGGVRAVLQAAPKPGQQYDLPTIVKVVTNRIDSFGVAEPIVQQKPPDQIIIELPNVRNKDEIVNQLQATAQLEFRYFQDVVSKRNSGARYTILTQSDEDGRDTTAIQDSLTHRTFRDQQEIVADFQQILNDSQQRPNTVDASVPTSLAQFAPTGQPLWLTASQISKLNSLGQELDDYNALIADSPLVMTGADIKSNASAGLGGDSNGPSVEVTTTDSGTTKLANFSSQHVNELMAVILDGRLLEAANVESPLLDGSFQISGGFANVKQAQALANFLNAGALPVPLKIVEVESVEATLGKTAVHSSLIAGAIGLSAVLVFMAGYYLLPGLLADLALIIYALFTLAVFKGALSWLGIPYVTLTLPGIAGFILSVGMAVDANILIFERLKEELRNGKSLKAAIDAGFSRAFTAIRDSNICTLITCFILFSMGTSSVKGFALTLGIGVVISLFTAITVTRTFLYLLVAAGAGKNLKLFGLDRQWEPKFNAVKNRKFFYGLSLLIIVPGIVFWSIGGLKESIDFTGGTQVAAVFQKAISRADVESALVSSGYTDNLVQMASNGTEPSTIAYVSVPNPKPVNDSSLTAKQNADRTLGQNLNTYLGVENALDKIGKPFVLQSHSLVGGVISAELKSDAIQAVLIAACFIVLYLGFAFSIGGFVAGLRFGTSAIIALVHDLLVLIGVFSILGYFLNWQIDNLFVTALLTVVGFSVHDTIVIFDRLRENLRHRNKTESFDNLANRSIQQSFARSINTSFTVVLTLVALLVFGEASTKLLDWALLIGIISGTYSSIFNATPILVDWENWLASRTDNRSNRPTAPYAVSNSLADSKLPELASVPSGVDSLQKSSQRNGAATSVKPKKRTSSGRRF